MTIEFHCPNCSKFLRTEDEKAGVAARCPGCGVEITVPGRNSAAAIGTPTPDRSGGEAAPIPEFGSQSSASVPPVTPPGTAMKPCPMCGEQIRAAAIRCRYCGEEIGASAAAFEGDAVQPHRGTMILVFGILSWVVCPVFGIVAWVMGNSDLREIAAGRMDPAGEGLTKAGKIVGMIHVIFATAIILLWCLAAIVIGLDEGLN